MSFDTDDRGTERNARTMLQELSRADEKFSDHLRRVGWGAEPKRWEKEAEETVQDYIRVIRDHRDSLTEEELLDPRVRLSGNVDPVFSVLLRAMVGPQVITNDVFSKIRGSWCHSDLPDDVDELLQIQEDFSFVRRFERVELDETDNIKLLALQRIGVRELVDEAHVWREKKGI